MSQFDSEWCGDVVLEKLVPTQDIATLQNRPQIVLLADGTDLPTYTRSLNSRRPLERFFPKFATPRSLNPFNSSCVVKPTDNPYALIPPLGVSNLTNKSP